MLIYWLETKTSLKSLNLVSPAWETGLKATKTRFFSWSKRNFGLLVKIDQWHYTVSRNGGLIVYWLDT